MTAGWSEDIPLVGGTEDMMTLLLVVLVLLLPLLALDYAALRWGIDTTDSSERAMSEQQYRYGCGD